MLFRIIILIAGVLVIYSGIDVIKNEAFYYFGNYIHLGKAKVSVGIAIIVFGLLIMFIAIRKSFKYSGEEYVKCVKCLEVYSINMVQSIICPKCGNELEELEGFYERHPSLKKEENKDMKKEGFG